MTAAGDGRETLQELRSIDILSFFDSELRPIFCLDTQQDRTTDTLEPIYSNTFFRISGLWARLVPTKTPLLPKNDPAWDFIRWAQAATDTETGSGRQMKYEGIHWSKTTILDRWRVICGTPCADHAEIYVAKSEKHELEESLRQAQDTLLQGVVDSGYREASRAEETIKPDDRVFIDQGKVVGAPDDLNQVLGDSESSDVQGNEEWLKNFDWESTSLGPRKDWELSLRRLCGLIMADPGPASVLWGPKKILLYNRAYRCILGGKHPSAMGQPFLNVWNEAADVFAKAFDEAASTHCAITQDDTEFHVQRNGYIEQVYCTWSMIPMFNEDDDLFAFYNPVRETTKQKILYRRMALLLGLSQGLSTASMTTEFWSRITNALDDGPQDVPLLLVYGAEGADANSSDILEARQKDVRRWELKGTIGYPKDLGNLPRQIDFDQPADDIVEFVARVEHATDPVLISTTDGSFPACMMTSIHMRSFGEKCSQAVFCPIRPSVSASMSSAGFIVLGINPRRAFDENYKLFAELLMRQVASSMAAVLLFADSVERGKRKAEVLSQQLATQTKIAADHERRFQTMAQNAPVGIFELGPDGNLKYGNDYYRNLVNPNWDDRQAWTYLDAVSEADQEIVNSYWHTLTTKHEATNAEVRLKRTWTSPDGVERPMWVVAAAYPQFHPDGDLAGILGCMTDISQQKWAEEVQARRSEQAIELKRQQEMFIDMTSHEIRNPLSAIIQSADSILATFDHPDITSQDYSSFTASDIAGAIDAAQTIVFCAQHQKRISDDVLILSKLNSNLVAITPVDVRPAEVILNGLRVFDRELKKSGIQLSMRAQPSYYEVGISSLRFDPSRTLQVLINLVSNSIKFTETQHRREITVRFGASLSDTFDDLKHIRFWDKDTAAARSSPSESEEWGDGEIVYLYMSVEDTGGGLQDHELDILFRRFQQATPRTHIQYGGSGLGLFICKKLSEAQGGAIGVSSKPGQGSTFAFYVKTRRSPASVATQPVVAPVSDTIVIGERRQMREDTTNAEDRQKHSEQRGDSRHVSVSSPLTPSETSSLPKPTKRKSLQQPPSKQDKNDALHVLIVEDNLVNQKVLAKQLDKVGYGVAIANHGMEALGHLEQTVLWTGARRAQFPQSHAINQRQLPTSPSLARRRSSLTSASSDNVGLVLTDKSTVSRASSDRTALTSLSADDPPIPGLKLDVILMDLEMPVMDGLTCVKRIRELQAEGKLARVPVIAVTANARQEQINVAMQAGMDSVVCKPFRIPELVDEIMNTLKRIGYEESASTAGA